MEKLWKKIDQAEDPPFCLDDSDICYYAREFVSRGGYQASEANNLISNFKKDPSLKDTPQWRHKLRVAQQFAVELDGLLPTDISIALIPSSKISSDPEYDPRMDIMLGYLAKRRPDIKVESPLRTKTSSTAVHQGGQRKVTAIMDNLEWLGLSNASLTGLVLVDDVITSGAHYKACQRMVQRHAPAIELAGIFWARTVWPE